MERSCIFSDCKAKAEFYCLCSLPNFFVCRDHLAAHMSVSKIHTLKNIYTTPNANTKNEILTYIKKERETAGRQEKRLKKFKSRSHSGNINWMESKVSSHISLLDGLAKKIQKTEKISEFEEDTYIKLLMLVPEIALKKFKKALPKLFDEEFTIEMNRLNVKDCNRKTVRKVEDIVYENNQEVQKNCKKYFNEVLEERKNNLAFINVQSQGELFSDQSFIAFPENDEGLHRKINNFAEGFHQIMMDSEFEEIRKLEKILKKVVNANDELAKFDYCVCCHSDTFQNRMEDFSARIGKIRKKFQNIRNSSQNMLLYQNNKNVLSSFQNLEKLAEELFNNFEEIQTSIENGIVNKRYLYIIDQDFIKGKTRLTIWDTVTNEIVQIYIENISMQLSSVTCPIPYSDDLLICVNGFICFENSEYSCIINTSTNEQTQILEPFIPSKWVGGIKYRSDIYLFGGDNTSNQAWKYIANEGPHWKSLRNLPEGAERCSCAIWKDSILICGLEHNNLWKYKIDENIYEQILVENEGNMLATYTKKILFVSKQTIYIMEQSGRLWISDKNNEDKWHMVVNKPTENFYREYKGFHNGKVFIGLVLYDDTEKLDCFHYYYFDDEQQKLLPIAERKVEDDFNESVLAYRKNSVGAIM